MTTQPGEAPADNSPNVVYTERIFGLWANLLFGLAFLALLVTLLVLPPMLSGGADTIVFWTAFGLLILVALIWVPLSNLRVIIGENGFEVRIGFFHLSRPWSAVTGAHRDSREGSFYGGWGVKGRKVGGKWIQAFTTVKQPRVVIMLEDTDYRELVFSTRRPDEVLELIEQYAGPFG